MTQYFIQIFHHREVPCYFEFICHNWAQTSATLTTGIHLYDCEFTDWTNDWDHHQDYVLPAGFVMKGVISVHDDNYE